MGNAGFVSSTRLIMAVMTMTTVKPDGLDFGGFSPRGRGNPELPCSNIQKPKTAKFNGFAHGLLCSAFLGLPYRILKYEPMIRNCLGAYG